MAESSASYQRYPVNFRTILQIAACHTVMASRMTSSIMGFVFFHAFVVCRLLGVDFPHTLIDFGLFMMPVLKPWRWLIFLIGLFLYALPVNLWAIYEMTRFEFAQFRLHPVAVKPQWYMPPFRPVDRSRSWVFTWIIRLQQGFGQLRNWLYQS